MRKILTLFLVLATVSLLLTGCAQKPAVTPPAEEPAAIETEAEIDTGATEMEQLEEDLDTSDLEGIEDDLASIDW